MTLSYPLVVEPPFSPPDVPVEQTLADLTAGKDTVLEFLKRIAANETIAERKTN